MRLSELGMAEATLSTDSPMFDRELQIIFLNPSVDVVCLAVSVAESGGNSHDITIDKSRDQLIAG